MTGSLDRVVNRGQFRHIMVCPVCDERKAKRACPALGKQICAVCCGTKRIVEISCPADCGYLASSRTHPPAVVQRQQEVDRAMLLPLLQGLSERQARDSDAGFGDGVTRETCAGLVDGDIAQAAGSLAATLETSSRGIVYEHQPSSLAAARLMAELKALVDDVSKNAGSAIERDAAIALRRIEHAAKMMVTVRPAFAPKSGASAGQADSGLQQLLNRVLAPSDGREPSEAPTAPAASLIIP